LTKVLTRRRVSHGRETDGFGACQGNEAGKVEEAEPQQSAPAYKDMQVAHHQPLGYQELAGKASVQSFAYRCSQCGKGYHERPLYGDCTCGGYVPHYC